MLLDIKIYPDKILRKKAKPVLKITDEERTLSQNMLETMRYVKGVGLAAPQVGISKRIIVIDALEKNAKPLALINPRVLQKKGRSIVCEGCLSVLNVTSDISRPAWVLVEALNLDGEVINIDIDGLLARVIQHEIDHLDGILFIDRIGFLKRKKVMKEIHSKICVDL